MEIVLLVLVGCVVGVVVMKFLVGCWDLLG